MDLIKQYLPLCWFDVSPLQLPKSAAFFKNNLIFNFLILCFIHFNMTDDIESISEVLIEILLNLGFIAFTLWLNGSTQFYVQVASAILFSENVVAIVIIPIVFWATVAENWWGYGSLLLALAWNWAMIAEIYKKALDINLMAGIVMASFYFIFSFGGGFALNSFLTG